MKIIKNIILPIVVFICGFSVMILEICASRIVAPFVGSSGFIWTIIIGVVLISLSAGYWLGGKLSDKKPEPKFLAGIVLMAGLFILLTGFFGKYIATLVTSWVSNYYLAAFLLSVKLFCLPNILLGMVSPFAIRLKLEWNEDTGNAIGLLYAMSTLGSLIGTFSAGYLLIPMFPVSKIIISTGIFVLASGSALLVPINISKLKGND